MDGLDGVKFQCMLRCFGNAGGAYDKVVKVMVTHTSQDQKGALVALPSSLHLCSCMIASSCTNALAFLCDLH